MSTEDATTTKPTQPDKRWKRRVKYVGGGTLIAGLAVGLTLAATHRQAQQQNLIAYLRGHVDGLKHGGWLEGWRAAEAWYAENGIEELVGALA